MMASEDDPGAGPQPDRPQSLADLGEDALIRWIREGARSADPRIIKGIGDDAAVVSADEKTVITTDLLIEDVHFRMSTTPPRLLGRKALSVNLSDAAAMAAFPRFAFLGLAAPKDFPAQVMEEIMEGFIQRAREAGVALAGGDVCRSDKLVMAVTLIGGASPPGPVYRSGARPGDLVFITGLVGDSALGLKRIEEFELPVTEEAINQDPLRGPILAHLDPPARVEAGLEFAGIATAMMDLSDGIMTDLPRLLLESGGRGAVIETARLPLSEAFREHFKVGSAPAGEALRTAVWGGEDYELLLTASPEAEDRLSRIGSDLGIGITRVGEVKESPGLILLDESGREISSPDPLFEHFTKKQGEKGG